MNTQRPDGTMPVQRPFFYNFLAAFRAHNAIQQGKTASPSSPQPSHQTAQSSPSQPRTITTSQKPAGATTTALTSLHSPRAHSTSPLSTSPGTSLPAEPVYGPHQQSQQQQQQARYMTHSRGRRGSDSSSEGFRDVLGAEKWYIGGRTAGGEERYFKLGVVRRQ